jgi:hypothetical protein
MGCSEQKCVCYNYKKRKSKTNYQFTQNTNELNRKNDNNEKKEIKKEKREEFNIEIEEKDPKRNIIEEDKKNIINNYEEESKNSDDNNIPLRNIEMYRELSPYLQTINNPNFNFPEVEGDKYVGKGLRRMKGYISKIPKDELEKRRKAFWGTRIEGNQQVWNFLKEMCELPVGEEKNIKAMLEASEITPLMKCINVTYDTSGGIYEIPNYCINDPVVYDLPETHIKKPKEKEINFYARKGTKQIKLKASNMDSVEKVKEDISNNLNMVKEDIRIFFGGKELKNGNELWMYNVSDDCVIIIL